MSNPPIETPFAAFRSRTAAPPSPPLPGPIHIDPITGARFVLVPDQELHYTLHHFTSSGTEHVLPLSETDAKQLCKGKYNIANYHLLAPQQLRRLREYVGALNGPAKRYVRVEKRMTPYKIAGVEETGYGGRFAVVLVRTETKPW
ncbi:hypothetical protein EX30DRAFT_340388 [Ascodesmis nigricans]|uniref:Uncharacterized protein n=1 Tax=Ascodesmis nigricans TaxID=341454 RepID=A0A4V3SIZ5_9PEZI|nr:hypothetical protein EX30DRAFT_340388 [Ascodesmis nigricans]